MPTWCVSDGGPGIARGRWSVFEPFYRAVKRVRPGRAWGWRSHAGSSRPTAASCGPSRCPARALFVCELPLSAGRRPDAPARWSSTTSSRPRGAAAHALPGRVRGGDGRRDRGGGPRRPLGADRPTPRSSTWCCPTATGCRSAAIREWSQMPILVLSAVGDEAEKIRALDAGADDYVTKPFAPGELVARLSGAARARKRPRRRPV